MNIVLVGLRGSGKTSVGKLIAEKLKRPFVDCDEYIEKLAHLSIKEIFEICGESYFRVVESEAIAQITKNNGQVIATGGGAVLRYKNVTNLKKNAVVFFLDVDPELAYQRVTSDPSSAMRRPPLTDKDPLKEIRDTAAFRRPYYLKAADHVIDGSRDPELVAAAIIEKIGAAVEE